YYVRRKDSVATGYYPYSSNPLGYLTSIDTTNISNFSVKVRSLFSATSPIVYSNGNYSLDTNIVHSSTYNDGRYLQNITGLVTQGTNVTITGSGTSGSPYVVNSSGGGGGGQIFNIGSGFRWVKPTDTVKTAFANSPLSIDSSSNTNGLTIKADTTVSTPIALVTQNQLGKKADTSILAKFLLSNP